MNANQPESNKPETNKPETNSPQRDELPLPDFDHLPVATLGTRIASLSEEQVTALLEYERAHGDRMPVKAVLEGRIGALRKGAEPSGTIAENTPEVEQTQHGSKVKETSGPKVDAPSLSDPINPDQPYA